MQPDIADSTDATSLATTGEVPSAVTTALVQLRQYPNDSWGPVVFHYDTAACDHGETMCPECFESWAIDHRVGLPKVLLDFCRAAARTAWIALHPDPAVQPDNGPR